jgi:SAM-dependent methyltransferase
LSRLGHRVLGIDASPVMVRAAASVPGAAGRVAAGDAAALPVADAAADCAVAFMSLQDVDHMEQAVAGAARVLVPGGRLVIAVTHPASTAGKFAPGPDEAARPFVIDGSWFERRALAGTCERDGYTMTFHSWHRPLQACTDALADTGFLIERIREVGDPSPADKWHSHAVPPPPRPALVRRNISSDAHMGMPGLTSTQVPAPAESGTR